jgi:hypothetical protein
MIAALAIVLSPNGSEKRSGCLQALKVCCFTRFIPDVRRLDLVRKGFFESTETVLFVHTGGQPALFAEQYANAFKSRV